MPSEITNEFSPDEIAESFEMSQEIANWASRFVIPLYKQTGSKPELIGSAFLVRLSNRFFLVTAAHVLDFDTEEHRLFYFMGRQRRRYLDGKRLITPLVNNNRREDHVDVGVVALTPGQQHLPDQEMSKLAVEADQLSGSPVDSAEYGYAICGFPLTKNRTDTAAKLLPRNSYTWLGKGCGGDMYTKTQLSPHQNLLVKFPRQDVWRADGVGPIHFPDPKGISGAPIWRLFRVENRRAVASEESPVVAGVAIEHRGSHKIIVGSNILNAIKMIGKLL